MNDDDKKARLAELNEWWGNLHAARENMPPYLDMPSSRDARYYTGRASEYLDMAMEAMEGNIEELEELEDEGEP
jgi:hypothetical protein